MPNSSTSAPRRICSRAALRILRVFDQPVAAGILHGRGLTARDALAAEDQARSAEIAPLNGLTNRELQLVPAAEIANRGDSGCQVASRVVEDPHRHATVIAVNTAVRFASASELDVAIDQSRQQKLAGEVHVEYVFLQGR